MNLDEDRYDVKTAGNAVEEVLKILGRLSVRERAYALRWIGPYCISYPITGVPDSVGADVIENTTSDILKLLSRLSEPEREIVVRTINPQQVPYSTVLAEVINGVKSILRILPKRSREYVLTLSTDPDDPPIKFGVTPDDANLTHEQILAEAVRGINSILRILPKDRRKYVIDFVSPMRLDGQPIKGEGTPGDAVDHPVHYNASPSGVECITVVEHMTFNVGNAVKYLWRAGIKAADPVEDLKKAAWYVQREIERLSKKIQPLTTDSRSGRKIGEV